jgi:UDP-N-acetyl-2-amino-2-deoxyglucuronate dehydrogenase
MGMLGTKETAMIQSAAMQRRSFVQLAAGAAASASPADRKAGVALLTHADGPHLSAYIEAITHTEEISTAWLSDPTGATVASVTKGLGAKWGGVYRSPRELFAAQKPALALVTMEAAVAPPAIDAALDAGCHVMAEKPACVREADFAALARKANEKKRNLMLALANRTDPVFVEARRIVTSGLIGKVYGMDMHTIADQTRLKSAAYQATWIAKKERSGGGHLIWLGIHWLDLAMYITGSKITQIAGFTGNVGGQPLDTEDSAAVAFRFANGAFGNLTSGYYIDRGKHLYIKIWGSNGWLEIHHAEDNPLVWVSGKSEPRRYSPPTGLVAYTAYVTHVTRAALGQETPILSPDESLYVLKTIFAAYRAAETGQTQSVKAI